MNTLTTAITTATTADALTAPHVSRGRDSKRFTLVPMPHNAQPGRGSVAHWMPSCRAEASEVATVATVACRVFVWNPERGGNGAWDALTESTDKVLYQKAVAKAAKVKGAPLQSGDRIDYTGESGNCYRFLVD